MPRDGGIVELIFLRDVIGWGGPSKLWKCSDYYLCPKAGQIGWFVVSCALDQKGRRRTYLFAVDESGDTLDWNELPGSFEGDLDHERAVRAFEEYYTPIVRQRKKRQR